MGIVLCCVMYAMSNKGPSVIQFGGVDVRPRTFDLKSPTHPHERPRVNPTPELNASVCGIRRQQKGVESVEDNKCSTKLESENLFTNLASTAISFLKPERFLVQILGKPREFAASGSQWPQSGHRCDLPLRGKSRPL